MELRAVFFTVIHCQSNPRGFGEVYSEAEFVHTQQYKCYKSGSCVNDKRLSLGVYGVYSSIKIALKRYKDILQIQIKYNKMHNHSTLPTRSFIHSFIHSFTRSFIHSFIHSFTSHHSCITHSSHTASYYASHIHHNASQRIIPCITHSSHCISTHHTNKTLYTTNHTDICA